MASNELAGFGLLILTGVISGLFTQLMVISEWAWEAKNTDIRDDVSTLNWHIGWQAKWMFFSVFAYCIMPW